MSRKLNYYGSYASDIIKNGLELHYDSTNALCYSGVGTDLFDLQGNYDGVLNGVGYNPTTKFLEYDGVNDTTVIDSGFSLNTNQPFTIQMIVNSDVSSNTFPVLLSLKTNTPSSFIVFTSVSPSYRGISVGSSSGWARFRDNIVFTNGNIKLITITYDGTNPLLQSSFKIIEGNTNRTLFSAGSFASSGQQNKMGNVQANTNGLFFKGKYPFLAIYNRELTSQELTNNYNLLSAKFGV